MKVSSNVLALALAAICVQACGVDSTQATGSSGTDLSDTAAPGETPFVNQVLADIGYKVILPTYATFEDNAASLVTALSDYLLLLETGTQSEQDLEGVQAQWIETMIAWQAAEVLQLGPAAPVGALEPAVGAMGLRDEIYSWPTVNQCRVDQELVEANFSDAEFFEQELNNVYGLDASEYLLFASGEENACPPQASLNADGTWDQLSAAEIAQGRIAYSLVLAEHVLARADELHAAWSSDEGNFVADFANAGRANSAYQTAQEALNDLSDGLFYIEKVVKDYKLARPIGILGCSQITCPDNVESRFSRMSKEAIIANLQAAHRIFTGAQGETTGFGLEHYLNSIEGGDGIAVPMVESLSNTVAALEGMNTTIYDSVTSEGECVEGSAGSVCSIYFTLKGFTDRLKTNFLEVLELDLPASATGDSD